VGIILYLSILLSNFLIGALAPNGTPPMAVVDGQSVHDLPSWLPRLPLGTPQILLSVVILLSIGGGLFLIVRRKRHPRGRAQV
jgi:LPXTG-motif cell wall-anchored protein